VAEEDALAPFLHYHRRLDAIAREGFGREADASGVADADDLKLAAGHVITVITFPGFGNLPVRVTSSQRLSRGEDLPELSRADPT
jgi:hypothetical protein